VLRCLGINAFDSSKLFERIRRLMKEELDKGEG
jgi:hypothetical protein